VIALSNFLPLLRLEDSSVQAIRPNWLAVCLRRAADRAGYSKWWLADHVAESAICFLATQYEAPIIGRQQIDEIMRSVLQAIGYGEIATHYQTLDPPYEISLVELANEAGPGYELAFFQLLKERMQPAFGEGASNINVHGLQPCVRFLQSTKTWSRSCSQLRNEIVEYIRAQMERGDTPSQVLLTIR
jgi:hypothetical protein